MAFKNTNNEPTFLDHDAYMDGTQVTFTIFAGGNYVFNTIVSWKGHLRKEFWRDEKY